LQPIATQGRSYRIAPTLGLALHLWELACRRKGRKAAPGSGNAAGMAACCKPALPAPSISPGFPQDCANLETGAVPVGDCPALWAALSHREQCSRACHNPLWERACPRTPAEPVPYTALAVSRARPLPQSPAKSMIHVLFHESWLAGERAAKRPRVQATLRSAAGTSAIPRRYRIR